MGDVHAMMQSVLGAFLLAALAGLAMVQLAEAETTVEAADYGETVIITVASDPGITSFKLWLPPDSDIIFESFRAEGGWEGVLMLNGVLQFTSKEPAESAKFGIVASAQTDMIFWSALDSESEEIGTGTMIPGSVKEPEPQEPEPQEASGPAMTDESVFKIIPEKPNIGGTIRVVGQSLGAAQDFEFYIDTKKIDTFRSDENGNFVGTAVIPESQNPGRSDIRLAGADEQREISVRLEVPGKRVAPDSYVALTLIDAPEIVHRNQNIDISGTGKPNGAVTAEIIAPDGSRITSMIADIGPDGKWGVDEGVTIPSNAALGKYAATITDGRDTITAEWTVESNQVIEIKSDRVKFSPGETMTFSGTAPADSEVIMTLEDPVGRELVADVSHSGSSGAISFEFPTTRTMQTGTYTLIATLESEKEFTYAGLGVLPSTPVNIEMDKFHYGTGDTAHITFSGDDSDRIELLVVEDSNNKEAHKAVITLDTAGRAEYSLDLEGYKSTVYSAVIRSGNVQSSEIFAIDLKTTPSNLAIQTTKERYAPGESMLITGNTMQKSRASTSTNTNAGAPVCPTDSAVYFVTLTLVDAEGRDVREKNSFAGATCQISDKTFRVPFDAASGVWSVRADSGSKSTVAEFEVAGTEMQGLQITVEAGEVTVGQQKSIDMHVIGAQGTVIIEIVSPEGDIVKTLQFPASGNGEVNQPWLIPEDAIPGTYMFRTTYDKTEYAEATYTIEE